mgnify:CR=1 FL=1
MGLGVCQEGTGKRAILRRFFKIKNADNQPARDRIFTADMDIHSHSISEILLSCSTLLTWPERTSKNEK